MSSDNNSLNALYTPLWLCYGLVPIVAGLDKFTNILTDWTQYLPGFVTDLLPVSAGTFMMVVGVIEIVAGVVVLSKLTRLGAYVVMVWLVLIAINVALAGYLDIAVRDLVMALGAYTLAGLAAVRGQALIPGAQKSTATSRIVAN